MRPAVKNFVSRNSETLKGAVRLFNPDGVTPVDLSVYTALRMQVKFDQMDTVPLVDLSLGAGLTIYPSTGQSVPNVVQFVSSDDDADNIAFALGDYVYDVKGTRSGGKSDTVLIGTILFKQGINYDVPA